MATKPSGTTSPIDLDILDIPEARVKPTEPIKELDISAEDIKAVSKVNYAKLKKMLDNGDVLVAVTNDSDQPLILDWNLDALPTDIDTDFNKYLQDKYVQYEIANLVGNHRIVSIYQDNKTISFLDGFLAEKRFPVLITRQRGKESELRPSFVLNAGSSVIMTRRQADSLARFEKIKRTWEKQGVMKETPWLGFLKMKTIKDGKELFKYQMSFVTTEDVMNTYEDVRQGTTKYSRRQSGIIREEE